ncbi:hypothetical protein H5410_041549 [Solanum commersonii]|uniref:Uncharacterized protein n=1 Tax=Solanum commersonii TaxID=4109 RepID=A0A9J5XRW3_SOLCO|nr:hypothetical protein H5410_041549 [Solanum commersonii]
MKKGLISKSEAIALYMEEVKRDLMKNLDIDVRDISMASTSHTNDDEESCMVGEAQSANSNKEIDIDTLLQRLQHQVEESSNNTACKDKGKGKFGSYFKFLRSATPGRFLKDCRINPLDYPLTRRALGRTRIVKVFINLARIVYTCKGTLSKTKK